MIVNYCQEQMYTLLSVVSIFCIKKRRTIRYRVPKSETSTSEDVEEHPCAPEDPQVVTTLSPLPIR